MPPISGLGGFAFRSFCNSVAISTFDRGLLDRAKRSVFDGVVK